ncbi:pyrroline-5-carboxylate reductase [Patescibacteria group bacterium]
MKIGIIGAGNMGSAFYNGLFNEFEIYICDKNEEKLEGLTALSTEELIEKCDIIILAIKPQSFEGFDLEGKLVISIMAGISIELLIKKTNSLKVVRAMPNLPVKVEKGLTGWIATEQISNEEKDTVRKIFTSLGDEIELDSEEKIDSITALSGSGPAYFFYLAEILKQKAVKFGFNEEEAKKIAKTTFKGAAAILTHHSPKQLREAVTSKGGTTEAAINNLIENDFDKIFEKAIDQAKNRSEELNQ